MSLEISLDILKHLDEAPSSENHQEAEPAPHPSPVSHEYRFRRPDGSSNVSGPMQLKGRLIVKDPYDGNTNSMEMGFVVEYS